MVNITKIKSLAKSKGIKYSYICEKLGLKKGYLNDVASGKAVMHDDRINTVAEILGTTYEYLTDQTDDPRSFQEKLLNLDKEKLRENMMLPDESHKVFTQQICHIEKSKQKNKFNDLFEQISKKETADKDFAELERFMEYLVKRD